jgi:hypothetical protein
MMLGRHRCVPPAVRLNRVLQASRHCRPRVTAMFLLHHAERWDGTDKGHIAVRRIVYTTDQHRPTLTAQYPAGPAMSVQLPGGAGAR